MVLPVELETWTDHAGIVRRTSRMIGRFKFNTPRGRALKAFIFIRDAFACQECGAKPETPPVNYDGSDPVQIARLGPLVFLVVDHIVSRMNGGTHHPTNLRTLCDSCNCAKAGREDAKHPNAIIGREQAERDRQAWLSQPRRRR